MASDLTLIPEAPAGIALTGREQAIAAWFAKEDDVEVLREARRRLAYYRRLPEEAAAAEALDLRARRRLGELVGPARVGENQHTGAVTVGHATPDAERQAIHRDRALAAVPVEVFEAVVSAPHPSAAKVMKAANEASVASIEAAMFTPAEMARRRLEGVVSLELLPAAWKIAADAEHLTADETAIIEGVIRTLGKSIAHKGLRVIDGTG